MLVVLSFLRAVAASFRTLTAPTSSLRLFYDLDAEWFWLGGYVDLSPTLERDCFVHGYA